MKRKESYKMIKATNGLFDKRIEHQRIKRYGKYSTIRTAIREEPVKLAQYLRDEKEEYEPSSVIIGSFHTPKTFSLQRRAKGYNHKNKSTL